MTPPHKHELCVCLCLNSAHFSNPCVFVQDDLALQWEKWADCAAMPLLTALINRATAVKIMTPSLCLTWLFPLFLLQWADGLQADQKNKTKQVKVKHQMQRGTQEKSHSRNKSIQFLILCLWHHDYPPKKKKKKTGKLMRTKVQKYPSGVHALKSSNICLTKTKRSLMWSCAGWNMKKRMSLCAEEDRVNDSFRENGLHKREEDDLCTRTFSVSVRNRFWLWTPNFCI